MARQDGCEFHAIHEREEPGAYGEKLTQEASHPLSGIVSCLHGAVKKLQ